MSLFTRLRNSDREIVKRVLVASGAVSASVSVGFVAVERFGVSNLGPRYWEAGPVAAFGYGLIGVPSIAILGLVLFVGTYALLAGAGAVVWLIGLPVKVAQWLVRAGVRGIVGYGLAVGFVLLMVFLLAWLGGFTGQGLTFWVGALAAWTYIAFMGGAAGAFGLVMGASWLALLSRGRMPYPADNSKTANSLFGIGYSAGAAVAWLVFAADEIAFDAEIAGVVWKNPWVVLVLAHLYVAIWVGLWRTTQLVRKRAGLLPRLGAAHLVWHRGGHVPAEPRDEFWSPSPIVAWRSWHWNGSVLEGHYNQQWHDRELRAYCGSGHPVPEWRCNCGVYAIKHPPLGNGVVGKVELTGLVIEHEDGYRAERALIVALWVPDGESRTVEAVRSRYDGVDVAPGPPPIEPSAGYSA